MKTIVKAKDNISRLWGSQKIRENEKYRLMAYVVDVEHKGKRALHNNVTGQLILLSEEEARIVDSLPAGYDSKMAGLIVDHFLVPTDYDEHKQVISLRRVMKKMVPADKFIKHYTILPTTACNARCYYCFEQGTEIVTMTEQIADDAVKFIASHCDQKKQVSITWFGGEPTVAANRIDQICRGLQDAGISYTSMMYTNGYLFDSEMAKKAKELWHLNNVQMSVDGTEQIYNKIKAYVNAENSPFETVIRNIGYMLENDMTVAVRMNVDYVNYQNFPELVQEFAKRYKGNDRLHICAYPLIGEYEDHDGVVNHADEDWIAAKVVELNKIAKADGFIRPNYNLPSLILNACMGDSNATITIGANGKLVECAEQYKDQDAVGNIRDGITNENLVLEWKQVGDYMHCKLCTFFPNCIKLKKCNAGEHCYRQGKNQRLIWNIQYNIESYFEKEGENDAI